MPFMPPFMVFARNQSSQLVTANAASYHTGIATAIAISAASRPARETWSDVYLAWGSRGHIKESIDLIIISRIQVFYNFLTVNKVHKASRHQKQTNWHQRYREQKLHRISCRAKNSSIYVAYLSNRPLVLKYTRIGWPQGYKIYCCLHVLFSVVSKHTHEQSVT